jgi:hypothetical protein
MLTFVFSMQGWGNTIGAVIARKRAVCLSEAILQPP